MDARIADGMGLDAQVEARRRAARARHGSRPPAHRLFGRTRPLDRADRRAWRRRTRCQPFGVWRYSCRFSASATIMSIAPMIAGLDRGGGRLVRRKHRARRREPADARRRRRRARSRTARWSAIGSRAGRRSALGRLALLQLLAGAMRELVQLQRRAAPRIAEDLGGPGERRLAVEGRTPDAPQAGVAREVARRRAGRACAPAGPPPRRMPASGRRAARSSAGQVSRQDAADARGMALQRQLLERVELFPGQAQHRGVSGQAPSAAGGRWRARRAPSTATSRRRRPG